MGLVALDTSTGDRIWASDGPFLEFRRSGARRRSGPILAVDTQQIAPLSLTDRRVSSFVWGDGSGFGLAERPNLLAVHGATAYVAIGLTLLAVDLSGHVVRAHTFDGAVIGLSVTDSGGIALLERVRDTSGEVLPVAGASGARTEHVLIGLDPAGNERWERRLAGFADLVTLGRRSLLLEETTVTVLDTGTGGQLGERRLARASGRLAVLPDGLRLLGADRLGTTVALWDLATIGADSIEADSIGPGPKTAR
ncbi:MAG: hypothetical protein R2715_07470 [Ilumatobacteraceae bacterium]